MAEGSLVVADGPALTRAAADWIADHMTRVIAREGHCSVALAGGSTPRPIYADLAARPRGAIDWSKVSIYFGDERAVLPQDPDSNFGMAREALLDTVKPAQVHRMAAERADRDHAADDYARLLPDRLDVLILGMGPDGHTASLFPGSPALRETLRRVVPVTGPKPPPNRLTITPLVIEQAKEIVVVAAGKDKAAAAARARTGGSISDTPIALARRGAWFLDSAAASQLTRSAP